MPVSKACEVCGQEFSGKPSRVKQQRFCSKKCKGIALRTQVTLECATCGKKYKTNPSWAARAVQHYCSPECVSNRPSNKVEIACSKCGKSILIWPSRVAYSKHRFCSKDCHRAWQSEQSTGENNPQWNSESRTCETCGRQFFRKPSHIARFGGKHCSLSCWGKTRIGSKNSNWRGGTSRLPYAYNWDKIAASIRVRDEGKCALCNEPGRQVHHIDYNRSNNDPANLILLCRRCHSTTNGHREEWTAKLTTLMEVLL